jgi:hypothetical protein
MLRNSFCPHLLVFRDNEVDERGEFIPKRAKRINKKRMRHWRNRQYICVNISPVPEIQGLYFQMVDAITVWLP